MAFDIENGILKKYIDNGEKEVFIPDGVSVIGNRAFYGSSVQKVHIPDTVVLIDKLAFCDCKSLEEIVIPDSVQKLGIRAFAFCNNLKNAVLGNGVEIIDIMAFMGCKSLSFIDIPDSVKIIGESAFELSGLENINIGNSVTHIGEYAFEFSLDFAKVQLPDSLEINIPLSEYHKKVFGLCSGTIIKYKNQTYDTLREIDKRLPDSGDAESMVNNGRLFSCNVDSEVFSIPENVTEISFFCNFNAEKITTVKIPKNFRKISFRNFYDSSVKNYIVDENNPYLCDIDGVLYSRDRTSIIRYPNAREQTSYAIPDTVTEIFEGAFHNCKNLKEIIIPHSVEYIGTDSFLKTGLPECHDEFVIVGNGVLIKYNGNDENVVIPDNITMIAANAFSDNKKIKSVVIPNTVKVIGEKAFFECSSLEKLYIPDSVIEIENEAFAYCDNLLEIRFSKNLISIGEWAFAYCRSLKSVEIPDSVKKIQKHAFACCFSLGNVVLGNSLEYLGGSTFAACKPLKSVEIPDTITRLTKQTFYLCEEIELQYKGRKIYFDGMTILPKNNEVF